MGGRIQWKCDNLNIMRYIVASAAVLLLICGCSVKEDRSACPCLMLLDFSQTDPAFFTSSEVAAGAADGFSFRTSVDAGRYHDPLGIRVPRTGVYLNVSFCGDGFTGFENGFTVPPGNGFPELYLHSGFYDTDSEMVPVQVRMHKSFCHITVRFKSAVPVMYGVMIEGDVCGYSSAGMIEEGAFSFVPVQDGDGAFHVNVPRQKDPSLMLKVKDETDILREFAIGEYIVESGYDWNMPDLEDVEIEIDYTRTDIILKVNDWETSLSFDITI